jgi:23S rRNA (uracil1939-C5)-methyltransferase/tRNA (uracil-5-)-methyltransferase
MKLLKSLERNPPKRGATLLFREHKDGIETDPRKTITQVVNGLIFKYRAGEFFQTNPRILPVSVLSI